MSLTNTSSRPRSASMRWTSASTCAGCRWSTSTAIPSPPAASTNSAVSSIVSGRSYSERRFLVVRPVQYTVAPASPSATAVPRPAPRVAPATRATFPVSGPDTVRILWPARTPVRDATPVTTVLASGGRVARFGSDQHAGATAVMANPDPDTLDRLAVDAAAGRLRVQITPHLRSDRAAPGDRGLFRRKARQARRHRAVEASSSQWRHGGL